MKQVWKQIVVFLLAGALCLAVAACGAAEGNAKPKMADAEMQRTESMDLFYTSNASAAGSVLHDSAADLYAAKQTSAAGSSVYRNSAVKLIRRANLTVQTTEFEQTIAALEGVVTGLEGYYESADLRGGSYYDQKSNRYGSYTIRIPAERYDEFMQQVDGIGYLARKNESSEDVGEAYHDIEIRLKTQRTKQERLLELLQDAKNMEDIIALENALTEAEHQIEQYTTELNRYDGLVSYATIHLSVEEMLRITDEPGEKAGLPARMKAGVVSSALGLMNGIQNIIVWFTYNLFGLLFLTAAVVCGIIMCRRSIRRRRLAKQKSATQSEE